MKKRPFSLMIAAVAAVALGFAPAAVAKTPTIRIDPGFEGDPGGGFWAVPSTSGGSTQPHDPPPIAGEPPEAGGKTPTLTLQDLGRLFLRSVWGAALPPAQAVEPAGAPRGGRR